MRTATRITGCFQARWSAQAPLHRLQHCIGFRRLTTCLVATQPTAVPANPLALRAAVARSMPLLQSSAGTWFDRRACSSCHHQGLGLLAVTVARERGFSVDEPLFQRQMALTMRPSPNWLEKAQLGELSINEPIGQSYRMIGVGGAGGTATPVTDAVVHLLAGKQHVSGQWPSASHRPPLEDSAFTATATTIRALRLFRPERRKADIEARIVRARRWLGQARPESTEDRVMQMLGLSWSGVPAYDLRKLADALLTQQRSDGGWAQLPTRGSDAYATGQVLVTLNQAARLPLTHAAIQRGLAYLLASQDPDGSRHVPTRRTVSEGQTYFESGYPHGQDQFISYAGAAWATMALALAGRDEPSPALVGTPPPRMPASPALPDPDGLTPLMRAALDGTTADLDRAVAVTSDINESSPLGLTALMFAAHDPEKTKRLLEAGADPARRTKSGHTALLIAAAYDGAGDSVDQLLRRRVDVDAAPSLTILAGLGPLARAALRGDTVVAERLLRRGAGIEGSGIRPLMAATWIGDGAMVTWLARRGAEVSAADSTSMTALMVAAEAGQTAAVRALLERGAAVHAVNADGYTALMVAAESPDIGHTEIIDLLLAKGADPAPTTADGKTAAALAERWDKPDMARRLRSALSKSRLRKHVPRRLRQAADDRADDRLVVHDHQGRLPA
jgi:ankyrin repeat protein